MKKYHVYGIGNALVDSEYTVTDQFLEEMNIEKGVMTLVDEERQSVLSSQLESNGIVSKRACGGSAANTIITISQFGGNTYYSCKVANDSTGEFYRSDLLNSGVSSSIKEVCEPGTTGKCLVMVTPDAERTMNTFLGITETISIDDLDTEALLQSEFLYIEGYLATSETGRQAAMKAKTIAQENGIKVALTFSDPSMTHYFLDQINQMHGNNIDLLFCNQEEALTWSKKDNLKDAMSEIKKISKEFAITLGSEGAVVYDGKNTINIPSVTTTPIDTNGAGDTFAGAFLYGLTHQLSHEQSGKLANAAASLVVAKFGPRLEKETPLNILRELNLAP